MSTICLHVITLNLKTPPQYHVLLITLQSNRCLSVYTYLTFIVKELDVEAVLSFEHRHMNL